MNAYTNTNSSQPNQAKNHSMEDIYIARYVKNGAELAKIRDELGLKPLDEAFHVTQAYSQAKVDWHNLVFQPKDEIITVSGKDLEVAQFGSAVVLKVNSNYLQKRHAEMKAAGASWDFPQYQPHITLGLAEEQRTDLPNTISLNSDVTLGGEHRETLNGEVDPA